MTQTYNNGHNNGHKPCSINNRTILQSGGNSKRSGGAKTVETLAVEQLNTSKGKLELDTQFQINQY